MIRPVLQRGRGQTVLIALALLSFAIYYLLLEEDAGKSTLESETQFQSEYEPSSGTLTSNETTSNNFVQYEISNRCSFRWNIIG